MTVSGSALVAWLVHCGSMTEALLLPSGEPVTDSDGNALKKGQLVDYS